MEDDLLDQNQRITFFSLLELLFVLLAIMGTGVYIFPNALMSERVEFQKTKNHLENQINALQDSVKTLQGTLEALKDSLASSILPRCDQVGMQNGYLAEISVLSVHTFSVDGDTLDLERLKKRYAKYLEFKRRKICVATVLARAGENTKVSEFINGVNNLKKLFYVVF